MLGDPNKLQYEREFAKQTREKFMGIASSGSQGPSGGFSSSSIPGSSGTPAAPASGTKYGGFGSEDIAKFGYNNSDQFGGGPYDPYTKT